jgi:hypothetical protein
VPGVDRVVLFPGVTDRVGEGDVPFVLQRRDDVGGGPERVLLQRLQRRLDGARGEGGDEEPVLLALVQLRLQLVDELGLLLALAA